MKIVYIAQRFVYPPDAGTPLRNYNLVAQISRRHQVQVYSFGDLDKYPQALADTGIALHILPSVPTRSKAARLRSLLSNNLPDMALRSYSAALLDELRNNLPAFAPDIVQIQALDMAYTLPILKELVPSAKLILDEHNAEYVLQQRAAEIDAAQPRRWPQAAYSFLQYHRLRHYEAQIGNIATAVLCVSAEDKHALTAAGVKRPMPIIPNGVDLSYYGNAQPHPALRRLSGYHFVFPGKMDFRPNVDAALWFAKAAFPLLLQVLPQAHFWIVGREPSPAVQTLAKIPNIHVTGEIDDVRPYFAAATAVVVPLRMGSGTKLKVLEAAAMRKAIITTLTGAEGYREARSGENMIITTDAAQMAEYCVTLAKQPALAQTIGENAYQQIAVPLDWQNVCADLEEFYAATTSA